MKQTSFGTVFSPLLLSAPALRLLFPSLPGSGPPAPLPSFFRLRSLRSFLLHPSMFGLLVPNENCLFDPDGSNRGLLFGPTGGKKRRGQKGRCRGKGRERCRKDDGWKGQGREAEGQKETGADGAVRGGQEVLVLGGRCREGSQCRREKRSRCQLRGSRCQREGGANLGGWKRVGANREGKSGGTGAEGEEGSRSRRMKESRCQRKKKGVYADQRRGERESEEDGLVEKKI